MPRSDEVRPVFQVVREHARVWCNNCRRDGEVCVQRLDGKEADRVAVERFRKAGWHCDGVTSGRLAKTPRWFCPACAKRGNNL